MEKQILNILYKYENKPADFNFVKEILIILRKHYHCEEQLKKVLVYKYNKSNKEERKFAGLYDTRDKKIYIDISIAADFTVSQFEKNIIILITILHEFAHVTQETKKENKTFENELLRISEKVNLDTKLGDLHDCLPDERMANITSIIWCINILMEDYLNNYNTIKKQKSILYKYMLKGYNFTDKDNLISPLEKILKEVNIYEENKQMIIPNNYHLSKRIVYGLPITKEEYDFIAENYNKYCDKEQKDRKLKIRII